MNRRRFAIRALIAGLLGTTLVGTVNWAFAAPPPVDCRKEKCVALTFDDGPVADSKRLQSMLTSQDAKATFFVVGEMAQKNPQLVRSAADAGFQIGNHSWDHSNLTKLSKAEIKSQLSRTDKVVKDATGKKPTTLRAPYGAQNAKVRAAAGRPLVHWNLDTLDWKYRDTPRLVRTVNKKTKPGDIVLMHDIHKTTVDAVPEIIKGLKARGFHLVTVDELWAPRTLPDGKVIKSNRGAYRP